MFDSGTSSLAYVSSCVGSEDCAEISASSGEAGYNVTDPLPTGIAEIHNVTFYANMSEDNAEGGYNNWWIGIFGNIQGDGTGGHNYILYESNFNCYDRHRTGSEVYNESTNWACVDGVESTWFGIRQDVRQFNASHDNVTDYLTNSSGTFDFTYYHTDDPISSPAIASYSGNDLDFFFKDMEYGFMDLNINLTTTLGAEQDEGAEIEVISVTYDANILETQISDHAIEINVTNTTLITDVDAWLHWNGTQYTGVETNSGGNYTFTYSLTVPAVSVNENITFNWLYNYTYDNSTIATANSSSYNQTINAVGITDNCTGNETTFNFWIKDETSDSNQSASMDLTIWWWVNSIDTSNKISGNYSGDDNYTFCLYPNYASFYADANISYYNTSQEYDSRNYYLRSATVDNSTSDINMYLNQNTSEIVYYVFNKYGVGLENYIVRFSRYFYDTDTYKVINMGLSDAEGKGILNLELGNIFYRAEIINNVTLERTVGSLSLDSNEDEIYLYIDTDDVMDVTKYWTSINVQDCSYSNTTMILSCSVTDTSGEMVSATLDVWRYDNYSEVLICSDTDTGSSISVACNLTDTTNRNFRYKFYGGFCCSQPTTYLFDGGMISFVTGLGFGLSGVFIALLLFLTTFFIGKWNPAVAVMLSTITIIVCIGVGIINLSGGMLGLVALAVATILLLKT